MVSHAVGYCEAPRNRRNFLESGISSSKEPVLVQPGPNLAFGYIKKSSHATRGWDRLRCRYTGKYAEFQLKSRTTVSSCNTHHTGTSNPFRTAVPFWGQTTQFMSSLSPERDCGPQRVSLPYFSPLFYSSHLLSFNLSFFSTNLRY